MSKNNVFAATVFVTVMGAASVGTAAGHNNPVDKVSNPSSLKYSNVGIAPRKMGDPFVRDGFVTEPQRFAGITTGLEKPEVEALLGAPLRQKKSQWDYNFKMKMPQSQNYFVCQYKVVFDKAQRVQNTVWRRQQCQNLANGESL